MRRAILNGSISMMICAALILAGGLSQHRALAGKCGPGRVWVSGFRAADGTWVRGFCRPLNRSGYVWIGGRAGPDGKWIPGHWQPVGAAPKGKAWVPGHIDDRGNWVPGHWRAARVRGKTWVPGHYGPRGRWIPGRWR